MRLGFNKREVDPNLYFKVVNNAHVILLLYVDDLFQKRCQASYHAVQDFEFDIRILIDALLLGIRSVAET